MESLQFQKAEYADPQRKCVLCSSAIGISFFQLAGQTVCPNCAEQARAQAAKSTFSRGLLYGAGAALACSICYAVITMVTGLQLAIASIAVGFLVGRAVRIGSRSGGRRLQILAVALTYLSITTSYVPLLIKDMRDNPKLRARATAGKSAEPTPAAPQVEPAEVTTKETRTPSFGGLLLAVGLLVGIALISPFFGLAAGVGGIIGIAIIYFGLMQAWKQTAGSPHVLAGPFTLDVGQA
jgi:hypothetical protein